MKLRGKADFCIDKTFFKKFLANVISAFFKGFFTLKKTYRKI